MNMFKVGSVHNILTPVCGRLGYSRSEPLHHYAANGCERVVTALDGFISGGRNFKICSISTCVEVIPCAVEFL